MSFLKSPNRVGPGPRHPQDVEDRCAGSGGPRLKKQAATRGGVEVEGGRVGKARVNVEVAPAKCRSEIGRPVLLLAPLDEGIGKGVEDVVLKMHMCRGGKVELARHGKEDIVEEGHVGGR